MNYWTRKFTSKVLYFLSCVLFLKKYNKINVANLKISTNNELFKLKKNMKILIVLKQYNRKITFYTQNIMSHSIENPQQDIF